jgi:hypothetical protein
MEETLVIIATVVILYVHLFNKIAGLYFDSGRTLTLEDIYRRVVPPTDFHIQL